MRGIASAIEMSMALRFAVRPGEAMGTVVLFPEARRAPHQSLPPVKASAAIVVILPVVRIEREGTGPSFSARENSKPPSGRKRRKRATPS